MVNIAIVEDEDRAIDNLKYALARYENEAGIELRISVFKDAELFLTNYKPVYDIVFMDIMLPGMDGMRAAQRMRKFDENVKLIFLTSMAQFAIKGYEVSAVDFIVKPFRYFDLKMRLDRVCRALKDRQPFVKISVPGGMKSVNVGEIYYIESSGHQLIYHTRDGEFTVRGGPIKQLSEEMEAYGFARCGVSYLVNLAYCNQVVGNDVVVGGDTLRITRGKKKEFVDKLQEYYNKGGV